jgi:hypothetical protein
MISKQGPADEVVPSTLLTDCVRRQLQCVVTDDLEEFAGARSSHDLKAPMEVCLSIEVSHLSDDGRTAKQLYLVRQAPTADDG